MLELKRTIWQQRARKALDSKGGSSESSVATTLEDAYRDGIRRAAKELEETGHRELAMELRLLAEDKSLADTEIAEK